MRHPAHRAARRLFRDSRGATVTEYAIMLFLVAVVAATGFRFLGSKLSGGMNKAGGHLEAQGDSTAQASGGAAPGGPAGAKGAAGTPTEVRPSDPGFGGARVAEAPKEGAPIGKFAMIALGVIGCGAAVFALMKGKHAR